MIFKFNLKDEVSHIRDIIVSEAEKKKHLGNYNFHLTTEHDSYLYDVFTEKCRSFLKFSLKEKEQKVWCLYNDKDYRQGNGIWHNHTKTSTINGVLYLKTIKGCGIRYIGKSIQYFEPEDFDLLIFPNYTLHCPVFDGNQTRVSINLELNCNESSINIFGSVAESVDAPDLKSVENYLVGVQVPPLLPKYLRSML